MNEVTNEDYQAAVQVIKYKERAIAADLSLHIDAFEEAITAPLAALNVYRDTLPPTSGTIPTNFRNLVESLYMQVNSLRTQLSYSKSTIENELKPVE